MGNIIDAVNDMLGKRESDRYRFSQLPLAERRAIVLAKVNQYAPAFICGGFARDLFYGDTPKDMDICVYKCSQLGMRIEEDGSAMHMSFDQGKVYHLIEELRGLVREVVTYPRYETEQTEERLIGVIKLPELDVDIILYNVDSRDGVLDAFDCNLSQFFIYDDYSRSDESLPKGYVTRTLGGRSYDVTHRGHVPTPETGLVFSRNDAGPLREAYMRYKFDKLVLGKDVGRWVPPNRPDPEEETFDFID